LHFAAGGSGNEKVVAYLQRRGLSLEAVDSRGDTPLFWAARNGNAQLIRYITMGKHRVADINKQNKVSNYSMCM
jgi:ankyrin repeat protein